MSSVSRDPGTNPVHTLPRHSGGGGGHPARRVLTGVYIRETVKKNVENSELEGGVLTGSFSILSHFEPF